MRIDDYWKQFMPIEMYWHYINLFILLVIGSIGFIANMMVLIYLVDYRKFRRPGTYFLINIVLIDLLKATFNLPMNIISSIYSEWVFGQIGCNIYGFTGGILGFARISTMVVIAIERYYIINDPFSCLNQSTKSIIMIISLVWLYSGILLFCYFVIRDFKAKLYLGLWMLPAFFSKNGFTLEGFLTHCSFDYLSRDTISRYFMLCLFFGGFIIPLFLIIVFCYMFFRKLKSNEVFESMIVNTKSADYIKASFANRSLTKTTETLNTPNNVKIGINEERLVFIYKSHNDLYIPDYEKKQLIIQNEIRIIKILLYMIIMFCIAWLPYAILVLYAQFGTNIENYVTPVTTNIPGLFAKTSSIYYPLIFIASDRRCRKHLMKKFKIV